MKCEDCGSESGDVVVTECPYALEIYEIVVIVSLCMECYHERCMEI